jgi:hypothetical protein
MPEPEQAPLKREGVAAEAFPRSRRREFLGTAEVAGQVRPAILPLARRISGVSEQAVAAQHTGERGPEQAPQHVFMAPTPLFHVTANNCVLHPCTLVGGRIHDVGIGLSAVGLTTIHLTRAEELLLGQVPSDELFAQAGEIASADCTPFPDGRGPVDYKRHLAGVLTHRALRTAAARALSAEA